MCVIFLGGLIAMGVHGLVDFEYNTPLIWLYLGMAVATLNLTTYELLKIKQKNLKNEIL
jgi:hypothetical protein